MKEKAIPYSDEFKCLFIENYSQRKSPKQIFYKVEFDVELLVQKHYAQAAHHCLKAYNSDGIIGLRAPRKESSGSPRITKLSKYEIIERQDAKIKLLEEQLKSLKKLDVIEIKLVNSYLNLINQETYKLIMILFQNKISHFCTLLAISR